MMNRTSSKNERGQALIMVTMGVVFLTAIMGMVVDVGYGYYRKQVAQAAADSAVTAAVVAAGSGTITCGSGGVVCQSAASCSGATTGTNVKTGCEYGAQNGVANSNMTMASGVSSPVNGVAVKYWVTATVAEPLVPTFLRIMNVSSATVGATATGAVIQTGSGGGTGCLYILDPTAGSALNVSGASVSTTCGIYLNSNNTTNALALGGSATVSAGTAPLNMVNGAKISASGSGCKTDSYYGNQNPSNSFQCTDPTYGSAASDPLSSLPAPSYSGCDHTSYSWSNLSPPQTLSPGVYCGGINLGGGNITLNPGNYILNGGGLTIQGGSNTTVNGSGVFFYNTSNGYTAGSMLVSSQVNLNLKAPTSGTYEGIVFMQDHSVCPSTGHAVNGAPSNNTIKINGTIYTHCTNTGSGYVAQKMTYTGQSTSGYYTALVVDTLTVNGATNLVLDPTGGTNTGIGLGTESKPFLIQ